MMLALILPEDIFKPLFEDAALSGIIEDGKSLADAIPLFSSEYILTEYKTRKKELHFDLKNFLDSHFDFPEAPTSTFISDTNQTVSEHIHHLWPLLIRNADTNIEGSSLIPLPYPYIVPGGRFNEIYYWDSYFTMLGLKVSGRYDMIQHMVNNFAWLIQSVGFIPNGNRSYFLSRSQPPFFSLMVALLADIEGESVLQKYSEPLAQEYQFWMKKTGHTDQQNNCHCVGVGEGEWLNRYFDALDRPRSEMFAEDVHLASLSSRNKASLYRDLRSACESGWDFSSRWCSQPRDLTSIQTTDILPVDLNCLLYHHERIYAKSLEISGELEAAAEMKRNAERRSELIMKYFWNEEKGYFFDFNFVSGKQTDSIHLGGIFPLFFNIPDQTKAKRAIECMKNNLLREGGLLTTTENTGQQWDAPNGWAPLQWVAFRSLLNYGDVAMARTLASRWTLLNEKIFKSTGKMMEKYNVENIFLAGAGGEYPVQDGFGWTNGVYLAMKAWMDKEIL